MIISRVWKLLHYLHLIFELINLLLSKLEIINFTILQKKCQNLIFAYFYIFSDFVALRAYYSILLVVIVYFMINDIV